MPMTSQNLTDMASSNAAAGPVHARSWWHTLRIWWFIAAAAALAVVIAVVIEQVGQQSPTSYGAFLDQLEAGNVASVTFKGTEINGKLKHPADGAQDDTFRSLVPDFGDPTLIPELRRQHVTIDVTSLSSSWTRWFAGIPVPMLLFIGAALIAGLVRLVRGGKTQTGSAVPIHPMQGMMGLAAGLFGKQQQAASPATQDSDSTKSG
jgi:ATP-dependent Zn protease